VCKHYQDQDIFLKTETKTKTKTCFYPHGASRHLGLDDYITGSYFVWRM